MKTHLEANSVRIFFVFFMTTMIALAGCGGGRSAAVEDGTQTFSGYEYVVVSQSALALTSDSVSGEGMIAFKEPLGSVSSNKNVRLAFQLEDGSFAELRTHADKTLSGGVQVRIARRGNVATLSVAAGDKEPVSRELAGLPVGEAMLLSVDVHNTETPAHVLVWDEAEKVPTDDNARFNSDADGVVPGNGIGMFWGLALSGARVSSVSLGPARFAH